MTSATSDLAALLSQVKMLEADREKLAKELENAQKKIEEEQRRLEETNAKMGRLTEGKRAEMQQAFDTVIKKWLIDSVQDEKVRQEFQTGITRLVENTAEDSGVWQVRGNAREHALFSKLKKNAGGVLRIEPPRASPARARSAQGRDRDPEDIRGGVPRLRGAQAPEGRDHLLRAEGHLAGVRGQHQGPHARAGVLDQLAERWLDSSQLVPLTCAYRGHASKVGAVMPAPRDLGLDHPVLFDAHRALERERVADRLVLPRALAGRLAGLVQLVEVGKHFSVFAEGRVQALVEHAKLARVDDVQIVITHQGGPWPASVVNIIVVVVKKDGRWPVPLKFFGQITLGLMHKGHDHHGRPLVVFSHLHCVVLKFFNFIWQCPIDMLFLLSAVVPVVGDIPEPHKILLVKHNGALVVLVGHSPYTVHGIIINT